jgi:hypothetical protein
MGDITIIAWDSSTPGTSTAHRVPVRLSGIGVAVALPHMH